MRADHGSGRHLSALRLPHTSASASIIVGCFLDSPNSAGLDWIGLFKVGDPNTGEVWWNYTWGATSGTYNLTAPNTQGVQYKFHYFLDNTRSDVKRSVPVSMN